MWLLAVIFRFILLYLLTFSLYASSCLPDNCMMVVDAGSSGSRVHVYSFELDESNSPRDIKEFYSKKIIPGISSLSDDQATMDDYLSRLFKGMNEYSNVPLYFNATAGMRLISPKKQDGTYDKIRKWLNENHYNVKQVKTISGAEEGLYGWLSVNYRMNRLNGDASSTVGVMDMGGASVQIVFQAANTQHINDKDVTTVKIYNKDYQLYNQSFLGLGENEVMHQLLNNPSCFANGFLLPSGGVAKGESRYCNNTSAILMNRVHHVNRIVAEAVKDNPVKNWFAMGGISYLLESKPFDFNNHEFTPLEIIQQADNKVCKENWTALQQKYPSDDYLYAYCLNAAYYHALLVNGYGFNEKQTISYASPKDNYDWTLGVVLKHA